MIMGSQTHTKLSDATQKKENPREILYLRYIDNKCLEILKMFKGKTDLNNFKDVFISSKAKELTRILEDYLVWGKMEEKFPNIEELTFNYKDCGNIDFLEEQMGELLDFYVDPKSYQFDDEAYRLNIDKDLPGFKKLFDLLSILDNKIEKEYEELPPINLDALFDSSDEELDYSSGEELGYDTDSIENGGGNSVSIWTSDSDSETGESESESESD